MACNTGGPAYPRPASIDNTTATPVGPQSGMSLLDYYVGQALAGILSNPNETTGMAIRAMLRGGNAAVGLGEAAVGMAISALAARDQFLKQHEVTRVGDEHRRTQVADPPAVPEVQEPAGDVRPGPGLDPP